jgi:hypothetical protein
MRCEGLGQGKISQGYHAADMEQHLAQINVAGLRAPMESPVMEEFVGLLDPVNKVADESPGFVWRLQTDDGNATSIKAFDDEMIVVNMSVWESVEALQAFVYRTRHIEVLRRRKEWFEQMAEAYLALWWIPVGSIPTVADGEERIRHVREHGPTPYAFTLRAPFDAGVMT